MSHERFQPISSSAGTCLSLAQPLVTPAGLFLHTILWYIHSFRTMPAANSLSVLVFLGSECQDHLMAQLILKQMWAILWMGHPRGSVSSFVVPWATKEEEEARSCDLNISAFSSGPADHGCYVQISKLHFILAQVIFKLRHSYLNSVLIYHWAELNNFRSALLLLSL